MVSIKAVAGLGMATLAFVAAPASAQQLYYEDGNYLYAVPSQPEQADDVVTQTVPVQVQGAERVIPTRRLPAQAPVVATTTAPAYQGYYYAMPGNVAGYTPQGPGYLPNGARLVTFDRRAWIDECSVRLADYEDSDRGRVLGALLGGVAGGLIGNRIADGERLGGTLIGAGAGALAGAAIGDALDDDPDPLLAARDECTAYLDDYMARASQSAPTTYFVPGQQYMLVEVNVPVAQQAVYREVVIEDEDD